MTAFGNFCNFEFELKNTKKINEKVYSPLLSSSSDEVWQITCEPVKSINLFYFFYVTKITSHLDSEVDEEGKTLPIKIYIKNSNGREIKGSSLDSLESLGPEMRGIMCKGSDLTDNIIIGVQLNRVEFSNQPFKRSFKSQPISQDLKSSWASELHNPNTTDVKMIVEENRFIYASSSLLAKRSAYFQTLFEGHWVEYKLYNEDLKNDYIKQEKTIENNNEVIEINEEIEYKYVIEIKDFDYRTVLKMMEYLYTDQVIFEDLQSDWNLYTIADKYMIDKLSDKIKEKILEMMNVETAAEILYDKAWRCPDMKESVMEYVIKNFSEIRQTDGYKHVSNNPLEYPMCHELNSEILLSICPDLK